MASSLAADSSSVEINQETSNDGDMNPANALVISPPAAAALWEGEGPFNWDVPDLGFVEVLDSQMNDKTVQDAPLEWLPMVHPLTPPIDQILSAQHGILSPNVSMPMQPTSHPRSLLLRPKFKAGAHRTATLILHTLKSYLVMMLRHNTLPPFIHPHLISSDIENPQVEPLTNCINLVHMISSEAKGSRKLFWKNVRLECERLLAEVGRASKVTDIDSSREAHQESLASAIDEVGNAYCHASPFYLYSD